MSKDFSTAIFLSFSTPWMKRISLDILLGFLFIQTALIPSSFALDPHKAITQYTHTNWQTEEGLPQIAVQCITQTRDGYLWVGTQEGIVRFDGVKFTVFDRNNTEGINHNSIQSLLQTTDGNLWVGTEGGLTRMQGGKFVSYAGADGLANNNVADLYEDAQKNLWIATSGGGLSVWKNGKFTTFTTKDGLAGNYVTSVTGGNDGTLYIGTTSGLVKFANGVFTTYTTADGLADIDIRVVYLDTDGVLWVGTVGGLCRFKNRKWTTFTTKDGLVNDRVRSLWKDRDGNLWIGTNGGGLSRMSGTQISSYSPIDGLIDGYVSAFCEDSEGSLWVGTVGGGLNRFHDGCFTVYGEKDGLAQDNVRAIYEARDGSVWVGADIRGLTRFKNGSLKVYTAPKALANDGVRGLCEGTDGSLWIGTFGGGLCRLKDGKFTTFTTKDGLAHERINSLFMSKDGTLWIGTRGGGISTFKNEKFTNYMVNNGLAGDIVRTILETSDGSIWISTNGGLNRFKDGKFSKYSTENGLSYDIVYSLFEDEAKALWIGTYGGGLNRFKDGRFTVLTTKQGMYDNAVFQILEDDQKNFWLTCNRGVYRVSEKELNDCADGKIQTVHCTVFGTADGMRSAKCNGSSQPAGIRTRDGKLWIPTLKGVAIVDPARFVQSNFSPPVFVEQILFDRRPIKIDSVVQLGPGHGELEVHYTALSFGAPKLVSFKYMLVGFDKDWIDAGTRRAGYYTNIPPGSYTFNVIACNNDGVWNLKGATIELDIAAYFYQTNWFRGLMTAIAILMGLGAYRIRVKNIQRHERELVRIVEGRTKDLQLEIGERKRAELALRESESKIRTILAFSPNSTVVTDLNGKILECNQATLVLHNFSDKTELLGKNSLELIVPEERDKATKELSAAFEKEYLRNLEFTLMTKDGKKFRGEFSVGAIRDSAGNPTSFVTIAQDITERKKIEEAMLKFRLGIERSPDAVFITDPSGMIIFINPAFEHLYGYNYQEAVGSTPRILKSGMLSPTDYKLLWSTLLSKKVVSGEIINKTKDGRLLTIEVTNNPIIDDQDTIIGFLGIHRDITARKHAENALKESEKKYKSVIENIQDVFYRSDKNGRLIMGSPSGARLFGYSSVEEMLGLPLEILWLNPHEREFLIAKIRENGLVHNCEATFVRKDGTAFPVTINAHFYYDEAGTFQGTEGMIHDITERKQAEEALRESEEKFRTLAEQSPNMIFINKNGKVVYANAKCEEIIGYTKEEFYSPNFNFLTLTALEYVEIVMGYFEKHMNGKEVLSYEYAVVTKQGKRIDTIITTKLVSFEKERAILGIITDITERKRAEQQLQESEERYRRLVEFSPDAITVYSEEKIVYVNPAAVKLIGATDESQLLGLPYLDIVHPDYREAVRQRVVTGMIEQKTLPPMEEKFIRMDGAIVDVETTSLPIIYKGKPAMQTVSRDITEQKKLQSQLLQSQKIQSIGTLAGGIAHDFNNILAIILGYSAMLENFKGDGRKHAEGVAAINQAVDRGAALVRQILTFARKTNVAVEPVNIPNLVHELLSMLKHTFPQTITFTQTYTPDLSEILADRTQIHQTLLNLCVNSRDAMPNGGSITIKAEQRTKDKVRGRFPLADQEMYVCISISDTGEGMDEATYLRVFDPFFTTKEKGKGTGLGLSVVYGVMQSHHGFVDVESSVGHGTTFLLFFPVPPPAAKSVEQLQPEKVRQVGGHETILLVEDEYLLLKRLRKLLKSNGYQIYTATDGKEAMKMFTRHHNKIAAVLSDIGLPKMNGIDVFKKLKEMDPHVKVILASGYFEPDIKLDLQQAGAKGFIQKPYTNNEVLWKLRDVLDEKNK